MIQQRGSVRGLTTAAGIWIAAIIGMAVGVGMYLASVVCTFLIFMVIVGFNHFEHRIHIGQEMKVISIRCRGIIKDIDIYRTLLVQQRLKLSSYYIEQNYENDYTELNFVVLIPTRSDIIEIVNRISEVRPTLSITLSNQIDL